MKGLVLAAVLLGPLSLFGVSRVPVGSVQPLAWTHASGRLENSCTAWAVDSPHGQRWITAGHCVLDDRGNRDDHDYHVGTVEATVAAVDVKQDMAALVGGPDAVSLELSARTPAVEDVLTIRGYPFGFTDVFVTKGILSNARYTFMPGTIPYAIYNVAVGGGNSGSPVFDSRNRVVGVLQVGLCDTSVEMFCPESGGSTLTNLRTFVSGL